MQLRILSLITTLITLLTCSATGGQSPQSDTTVIDAWKDNPQVRQCGLCHFSPGNDFAARETDFCRMIEAKLWLTNDKHAIARRRIEPLSGKTTEEISASNRLSLAIVNRLGYAVETPAGYAQFRENCLTCHGGYKRTDDLREFEMNATNRPGISCNVCHQIGDDNRWVDEHSGFNAKQNWRNRDPHWKAERGMRSLVSVDAQADLCLQCHVGDIKQNMFVTHQMYAAGHPPLPSFELGAMLDAMPRHWRTNAELYQSLENYPERGLYFERQVGPISSDDKRSIAQLNWQVQTIVVGAVAAHQRSLDIVAQAASPNSQLWGDYALYDCAGCHHELKTPSARQAARVGNTPGRPQLAEWPRALSGAALTTVDDASVLKAQTAMRQAVAEKPFGNRTLVAQRASELSDLLAGCREKLYNESLKPDYSNRYLVALTRIPETELINYNSARQVNWALRGIDAELTLLKSPLPERARRSIAELGIKSGVTQISSEIPSRQSLEIFPTFVDAELARQSSFNPQEFRMQLNSIFNSLLPR